MIIALLRDADGLRDYILDHGWITMLTDPHKSLDNYHLLPNESMESVDRDICKQITHLHFAGRYGFFLDLIEIDFSSLQLQQVQHIHIMSNAYPDCHDVRFTGKSSLFYY